MKKFFKFVPVALGLMALASCSNDEFESQSVAAGQQLAAGDLIVTEDEVETEAGGTRSFLSRDMQTRIYVITDELKVYDNDLYKFDTYKFSWKDDSKDAGVFRRSNTVPQIKEAKWAIYPKADVVDGEWVLNEETENSETTATIGIPHVMTYDGTYDVKDTKFEKPLFKDVLPRWGQVTATGDGAALQTNLSYLTGILRLQLAGIPDYAKAVRIQMLEGGEATNPVGMSGEFKTIIAKNDIKQTDAALAAEKAVWSDEAIYVDLRTMGEGGAPLKDVDAAKAVVYVPLVTTTKAVDIVVSLCDDPALGDVDDDADFGGTYTYTEYKRFKNKIIKRGKVYGNSKEFNLALDGEGPEAISDALEFEEVQEGEDLILKANGNIDVCDPDNTILIPNKKAASITIDLSNVTVSTTCGSTLYVKYKDATGEGKYPGKVIVKTAANGGGGVPMQVDLDSTPFQISGPGTTADINQLNKVDASAFTIDGGTWNYATTPGAGEFKLTNNVKTLTINPFALSTAPITIDQYADNAAGITDVYVYGTSGDITNTNNAVTNVTVTGANWYAAQAGVISVGGNVTMSGDQAKNTGAITAGGTVTMSGKAISGGNITANGNVTISEDANGSAGNIVSHLGDISVQHNTWSDAITYPLLQTDDWNAGGSVTIAGNVEATSVKSNANFTINDEAFAGTVTLKGDATISNTKEMEAIATSIEFKNDAKLNLNQGYVKEVITNNKKIGLYHGEDAAFTAIQKVTGKNLSAKNISKWNGKQIGSAFSTYALATHGTDKEAWTASQVGYQLTTPASFALMSDIDLDNKDWKGIMPTAAYDIDGKGKTIKNVNLVQNKDGSMYVAGFIGLATAAVTANDLTLDGVKTSIKALGGAELKGVGGFIGKAKATATLSRVKVKLASGYFGSMDGTKNVNASNIGGVIGRAEGAVTLKGVTADLTGAILSGHRSLGGFVGGAKDAVDILTDPENGDTPETACAVSGLSQMWVTLLDLGEYENDPEQASTGLYIGQADLTKNITIEDAADVNPSFTVGGKADESKAFVVVSNKINQFSRGEQKLIGQSGYNIGTGKVKINEKVYCVKKTGETFIDGSGILYNVTVSNFH